MIILLIKFRNAYTSFYCIHKIISEARENFKIFIVHLLNSQMRELLWTTTVQFSGGRANTTCRFSLFSIQDSPLWGVVHCGSPFLLLWWQVYESISVTGAIVPLDPTLHQDIVTRVEIKDLLNKLDVFCPQININISLKFYYGNFDLEF